MLQQSFFGTYEYNQIRDSAIKSSSGCEAMYFRMDMDWGIKVLITPFETSDRGTVYNSIEKLKASPTWRRAQQQVDMMNYFYKMRRGPKVHELVVVEDASCKTVYPALIIEHISFDTADFRNNCKLWKAYNKFVGKLNMRFGNCDSHEQNVVYDQKAKRFKVIDFGAMDHNIATEKGVELQIQRMEHRKEVEREHKERQLRWQQELKENPPKPLRVEAGTHLVNLNFDLKEVQKKVLKDVAGRMEAMTHLFWNPKPIEFKVQVIDPGVNWKHIQLKYSKELQAIKYLNAREEAVLPEGVKKKRIEKRMFMEHIESKTKRKKDSIYGLKNI